MTRSKTAISSTSNSTPISLPATALPAPSTFTDNLPLPTLIVFDLDYTLWPFWVDTHVSPPLKSNPADSHRSVRDSYGGTYGFYNDVAGLLAALKKRGIQVGCASRTCTPDLARKMLTLLHLPASATEDGSESEERKAISAFDYLEAYPGSKTSHFQKIHKASKVPYEEMLFFDDESRNRDVEKLGVTMQLVRDGVTVAEMDKGVKLWRERNAKRLEGVKREG
ncbi:uncharacterized protein LTR77_001338 [Saxophila tyrrhenica]|uniref:Magnesium-dependent phosphatase n=1 Tax=Saxophila tyrrhenica TaxID=1690608 RepID=A0AAV9PJT8_9PEZI|nr:hypothetical protein LTR77_001338 [Saxophila tyrrhenica]